MRVGSITRLQRPANTLIELLIVIAIIAVLAGIAMVAINPKKNLRDAADAQRKQDMRTMIDAIYQYRIDRGEYPTIDTMAQLDTVHRDVCSLTGPDLFFCVLDIPQRLPLRPLIPDYLAELPHDPDNKEDFETGYQAWLDDDGRVHIFAPLGDEGRGIELAR